MQPGRQWRERIDLWIKAVRDQVYKPLGEVPVKCFFTMDELSAKEAMEQEYKLIEPEDSWGKKWEYAWFRFDINLPKEADKKRIVCIPDVGAESLCYIKNKDTKQYIPRGAYDKEHKEILISTSANSGEYYECLLESYAGHGPRLEDGGPVPLEINPVWEPPFHQCKMGHVTYGIWQEEAYQLYIDAFVLWDLYQILDARSLRAMEILDGLKEFTKIADVELEGEERIKSFIEARKVLAPLLACKNGSTVPRMSICGQSHLDLAWLWPHAETRRKTARTYSNQLTLMEEYPDYLYFSCDAFVIEVLKEKYPEVYEQYLSRVSEGRMIPEGVTYVEPDINMICGEALYHHIMEGVRRFEKLANTKSVRMLWLPDVFGFSGALPQIMKQCGIPYFATQKLMRQDPEAEAFPYDDFWWEGIDGSRVLAHIFMNDNAKISPKDLHARWYEHRKQETGMDGMIYTFGYGDGGGGPTRDLIEIAKRVEDLEGIPRTVMESPVKYFERMEKNKYKKPVYRGELYLAWHRGTYTSQSELKKGNRLSETALKEAELAVALAYAFHKDLDMTGDLERIHKLWDKLLFLQFHDILPGTSIQRVNEEAKRDFAELIKESWDIREKYRKEISFRKKAGNPVANEKDVEAIKVIKLQDGYIVENKNMRVDISNAGEVRSMVNLLDKKEYQHATGNKIRMYKNVNSCYDAWEMGSMIYEEEIEIKEEILEKLSIKEQTQDEVRFSYKKKIHNSNMEQQIVIRADKAIIYFETTIDWQERHKLLKACFYPEVHTNEGIEEIQYGYIKRTFGENHQFERDQYEVINHRYSVFADENHGMAILNDGKYGVHVADKEIALSLLRAPVIPDQTADAGKHTFTYACMIFDGKFSDSNVTKEAIALQHASLAKYAKCNENCLNLLDWFDVGESTIIPDWCYLSPIHSDTIILRVYQSMNQESTCHLKVPFYVKKVNEVTPFEEKIQELSTNEKGEIEITCKPFEIKTIAIFI